MAALDLLSSQKISSQARLSGNLMHFQNFFDIANYPTKIIGH